MESSMSQLCLNGRRLQSNVYKVRTGSISVFKYVITVKKLFCKNNNVMEGVEISRSGGQDATRVPRTRICSAAMKRISSEPGLQEILFLYEGCELLLTNAKITDVVMTKKIDPADLQICDEDRNMHLKDATYIHVKIAADGVIANITEAVKQSKEEDPDLITFYAMLSRVGAPSPSFVGFRGGRLFDQRTLQDIKMGANLIGQQRANGIVTGVRTILDPKEGNWMAIDLDATQGTFYKPQPIVNSIREYLGVHNGQLQDTYNNYDKMKGVEAYIRDMVVLEEGTDRAFTICGFKWAEEGRRLVAWPDACNKGDRAVKYRFSPVVVEEIKTKDGRIVTHCHPLESLRVLPYTKVPKEKQDAEKPRPIDPDTRYREINKARTDLAIEKANENATLMGFDTKVRTIPEEAMYTRLEAPAVYAARAENVNGREGGMNRLKRLTVEEEKRKWNSNGDKFILPASIVCLRIYYDMQSFRGPNEMQHAEQFGKWYVEACKEKGITIDDWTGGGVNGLTDLDHKMEQFKADRDFETARSGKAPRILLFYLGDREHHDTLKWLERRYEVLTQHVEPATVLKTVKKGKGVKDFTLHNIVLKTNEKCGGRNMEVVGKNTSLDVGSGDKNAIATLIIGMDVAHPPPLNRHQRLLAKEPEASMIGISSNALSPNPMAFCGDYVPTNGGRENVPTEIMEEQGKYLIEMFHKNHGRLPERIIYYRDGVSKGQYSQVEDELYALMKGAKKFAESVLPLSSPPFAPRDIAVLCTKRHNVRLFDKRGNTAYNPKAGTLVDTDIVSPFSPEFFLQAATAIIGTAKPLMCTVLKDGDKEMMLYPREDLKEIEVLTHTLCYTHEICDSPVSLPEPVYNAHENAKRGMNNLKSDRQATNQRLSFNEINERLSTRGTLLEGIKYNA